VESREYAILGGVALLTVAIGVSTTTEPLGTFFVESTGVVTHFLFLGAGLVPPASSVQIAEVKIEVNYKMVLNVVATGLFLVLYWLHRSSGMEEGGHGGNVQSAS
jgi:hypothetical protein